MESPFFFTYIVECCDGSFYTGSTKNLSKRVETHNKGRGAKYTATHLPVNLVYFEQFGDLTSAMRREIEIKKLPRNKKEQLVKNFLEYVNAPLLGS